MQMKLKTKGRYKMQSKKYASFCKLLVQCVKNNKFLKMNDKDNYT